MPKPMPKIPPKIQPGEFNVHGHMNHHPPDYTLVYCVVGLALLIYGVVVYILSSTANERKRALEKSK